MALEIGNNREHVVAIESVEEDGFCNLLDKEGCWHMDYIHDNPAEEIEKVGDASNPATW